MVDGCLLCDAYPQTVDVASTATRTQPLMGSSSSTIPGIDYNESMIGTSLTDTGNTYKENDDTIHMNITKVLDGNGGNRGMSTMSSKSNISQKIIEYRLYLEQINNEKQYVAAQLQLFHKQLDAIVSPSGTPYIGTHYSDVNLPTSKSDNSSNNKLNTIGNFFTGTGTSAGDLNEATILNILFGLLIFVTGYLIASKKSPS